MSKVATDTRYVKKRGPLREVYNVSDTSMDMNNFSRSLYFGGGYGSRPLSFSPCWSLGRSCSSVSRSFKDHHIEAGVK